MPRRDRYRRRSSALLLALASAAAALTSRASPAEAQPAAARPPAAAQGDATGYVLEIQDDELILDLGSDRGLSSGDKVEIWRPLKLKHPVTGKLFTDRFLLGTLELGQVRPSMSLARVTGTLTRDPQKGDIVIVAPSGVKPPQPGPAPGTAAEPPGGGETPASASPQDREAVALGRIMDGLRGADPLQRIRVYEEYVRTQPNGRFARVLYEEAASLRRIYELESRAAGASTKAESPKVDVVALRGFAKPAEAVGGAPLRLSVELSDAATGAVLHVRSPNQPGYSSIPMAPMGSGYFGATVPAERMVGDTLEFFIEATGATGKTRAVVAEAGAPERIEIQAPPAFARPKKLDASLVLLTDFADYNRLRGNDQVWQTEGYFQVRYGDLGVRALRTGFGVFRGVGGSVEDLDVLGLDPRKVGLTYGYVETEIGAHKLFSIIGRTVVGLDEDGVAGGGQILFRIGNDLQTNLVLGGELLGGVGLRGITQLELNTFRRFPILLRIEVSNQPAGASATRAEREKEGVSQGGGEVGGRGIAQVGWRILDPLVVSVRGSFQGRTINHAGPGFGAAVSYQW